jgi:hypothetical protein
MESMPGGAGLQRADSHWGEWPPMPWPNQMIALPSSMIIDRLHFELKLAAW